MKMNMHILDRVFRVIVAIAAAFLIMAGAVGAVAGLVLATLATLFLATALLGYCPLYGLLRVSTNAARGGKE